MIREIAHANGQHVIPKAPTDDQQFAREADVQRWLSRLQGSPVPPQLHDGLARYLGAGIHPGSFLTALLESRVSAAAQRADPICLAAFGDIVLWLYAFAPARAWGSEEVVQSWRASFSETCVRCLKPSADRDFDGLCEACATAQKASA